MLKKIISFIGLFFFALNNYSAQFDTIVSFGDSLSDNGNLYHYLAHIIPKSPPYYKGHFSNGSVWVETLYQDYFPNGKSEKFLNYSVGGAGAVLSYKENLPYTLTAEVEDYLYLHHYTNKDKSLFIIWVGANNYLNAPTNVDAITSSVVNAIGDNIKTLVDRGAVMFLVVNLPDMGKTPEASKENHQELLTELTVKHNQKLLDKYNELKEEYPNVNFAYFDVYSLFNQLMSAPQQFSITNIKDPCYEGGYVSAVALMAKSPAHLDSYLTQQAKQQNITLSEQTKEAILNNPALNEALIVSYQNHLEHRLAAASPSCTGYLFWDHVHPTTTTHQFIAQFARSAIDMAGFQAINQ